MVGQAGIRIFFVTIRRDCWREHLKGVLAGNDFEIDNEVEAVIGRAELVTPTFSQIKVIESISESPSEFELEDGNSSDKKVLVMVSNYFLESDRWLEED